MGFTKVFKMFNFAIVGTETGYSISVPYKDRAGNDQTTIYFNANSKFVPAIFSLNSNLISPNLTVSSDSRFTFLAIGDGDTPFSENDYDLDHRLTSGFSFSVDTTNRNASYDNDSGKMGRTIAYTINASSSITIKELGIFKYIYQDSTNGRIVLLYRTVLDNPISLAAGESTTIALSISGG